MGEQAFTVEIVDKTATALGGTDIVFPSGACELETHLVEVAPGHAVGRHRHPGPCWMYVLEGTIAVESDDGTVRTFEAGQVFVEDARAWVDNRNPGTSPARFLAAVVGGAGEEKVQFEE